MKMTVGDNRDGLKRGRKQGWRLAHTLDSEVNDPTYVKTQRSMIQSYNDPRGQ
jgi:hypothetical protein